MVSKTSIGIILTFDLVMNIDQVVAKSEESAPDCKWHQTIEFDSKANYVMAEILNLRTDPGQDSPIMKLLPKNQKLLVTSSEPIEVNSEKWVEVQVDLENSAYQGWVSAKHISDNPLSSLNLSKRFKDVSFDANRKSCEHAANQRTKVRGIYLTMYSSRLSSVEKYIELANNTFINSFVIDIKNERGRIIHDSQAYETFNVPRNQKPIYKNLTELSRKTKENGIYLIGKITAFKDDLYARSYPSSAIKNANGSVFEDRDGIAWVSPHDRTYWNYLVEIAKETARQGVQEIQFDYVRFPDSNEADIFPSKNGESKVAAIQKFLQFAYDELRPYGVYVSADVFGLVPNTPGDLHIGQHWEALSSVLDYISPMMYPSHYAKGFRGIEVPDREPYKTIFFSATDGVKRNKNIPTPATIRPWIQAFTASWVKGNIPYGWSEINQQIKALENLGIDEFLLWNPQNNYTNLLKGDQNIADSATLDDKDL